MWFGNRKVKPSGSEFATLILKLIVKAYPWDILSTAGLVEVHIDPLQLEVAGSLVHTAGVHAVLIADDLPELEKIKVCHGNIVIVIIGQPYCPVLQLQGRLIEWSEPRAGAFNDIFELPQ